MVDNNTLFDEWSLGNLQLYVNNIETHHVVAINLGLDLRILYNRERSHKAANGCMILTEGLKIEEI